MGKNDRRANIYLTHMPHADQFFYIFLATVLITRVFLFIKPTASPTVKGFRLHHYMYGIVLVVIGLMFHSLATYAIGLGLFVDEVSYLVIKGKTHKDNYSTKSILGTLALVLLVFICRKYLVLLI